MNALLVLGILSSLYVWTICRLCKKHPEPVELGPCGSPHRMSVIGIAPRVMEGSDYTIVLYRCSHCLTHQSSIHHGKWDLGDFVRSENEIDQLEAIRRRS